MRDLLEILFIGHRHKWTVLKWGNVTDGGTVIGQYFTMQCEHCGRLKSYKLYT